MPDLRESLQEVAGAASAVDMDDVRRRGAALRRRRLLAATTIPLVLLAAVLFVALPRPDSNDRSNISTPASTAPPTPPSTTSAPVVDQNPGVIAADPARSLDPALPPCRAEDFVYLRSHTVPGPAAHGLLIFFENRTTESCALLSYPTVEGLTEDGEWVNVPVAYDSLDPVSSTLWTGLVEADGVLLVTGFEFRPPSWYVGGKCPPPGPTSTVETTRFTGLRFALRNETGTIDVPIPLQAEPCQVLLRRFGDEHSSP